MRLESVLSSINEHPFNSEPEIGEFILSLKKLCGYKDVLEVGTFIGLISSIILSGKSEGETFVSIDIEDHRNNKVKEYFKENDGVFILGDSNEELPKLPARSFDIIYLDGSKELIQLRNDFKLAEVLLKKNGVILLHDYYSCAAVPTWVDYLKNEQFKGNCRHLEIMNFDTPKYKGLSIVKILI